MWLVRTSLYKPGRGSFIGSTMYLRNGYSWNTTEAELHGRRWWITEALDVDKGLCHTPLCCDTLFKIIFKLVFLSYRFCCIHTLSNNHFLFQSSALNVRCDRFINAACCCAVLTPQKMCLVGSKRTCPFGKNVMLGLFKEKKKATQSKTPWHSFDQCLFCAFMSSIPHIVVLEIMYKMKRVVVSENCFCHSTRSLGGMFFVPFFCHILMSGVTVNYLPSTVS